MYSFLLSENLRYSELLENLHVVHKRLTQSQNGGFTFGFRVKLGSTFVERSVSGESLLYVTAGVYRDGEYGSAAKLLCVIFYSVSTKQHILSVWEYINLSILKRKTWVYNWRFKDKNSSCCGFSSESANQFDFSPLMSVLLQLTHKTKILPWWFSDLTRCFHTWIFSHSFC